MDANKELCPTCAGSGRKSWADDCPDCKGTGDVSRADAKRLRAARDRAARRR